MTERMPVKSPQRKVSPPAGVTGHDGAHLRKLRSVRKPRTLRECSHQHVRSAANPLLQGMAGLPASFRLEA